jgi:hypothetical protein
LKPVLIFLTSTFAQMDKLCPVGRSFSKLRPTAGMGPSFFRHRTKTFAQQPLGEEASLAEKEEGSSFTKN